MASSLDARLKALEERYTSQQTTDWKENIPLTPEEFYKDFGYLSHPATGKAVEKLADYQYDTWRLFQKHRKLLEVKSNKVGESTKWLLVDFQLSILPSSNPLSTRGYDTLVIAQTKDHAKEHLRTLRKMIIDSPKYSKYLINKPNEIFENAKDGNLKSILRDEQSKTSVIYIHNPEKPQKPSRIIALGMDNAGAILSWKMVKHIHISDATAAEGDYQASIDGAMTRLANTNGTMVIETVPSPPIGPIYEMWKKYKDIQDNLQTGDFKIAIVTAEDGIKAGIITREFLEAERKRLGVRFGLYYMARFDAMTGNVFKPEDIDACIKEYDLNEYKHASTKLFVDPSYGLLEQNSSFAWTVLAMVDGKVRVYYNKEYKGMSYDDSMKELDYIIETFNPTKIGVDSAWPLFIKGAKERMGEAINYDSPEEKEHSEWWTVKPMSFSEKSKEHSMLESITSLVSGHYFEIHPKFTDLIMQMRMASTDANGKLNKDDMSLDSFDTLRMGASTYRVENQ